MYRLFDLVKAVRSALQPYVVVVHWTGGVYTHRAWTTGDAREWLAMYPNDAMGSVFTRYGTSPIARRMRSTPVRRKAVHVALWDEV
jgi:hypothetical protein